MLISSSAKRKSTTARKRRAVSRSVKISPIWQKFKLRQYCVEKTSKYTIHWKLASAQADFSPLNPPFLSAEVEGAKCMANCFCENGTNCNLTVMSLQSTKAIGWQVCGFTLHYWKNIRKSLFTANLQVVKKRTFMNTFCATKGFVSFTVAPLN